MTHNVIESNKESTTWDRNSSGVALLVTKDERTRDRGQ